ncbi:MAG: hypothetical protein P8X42_07160 [Calditrichaceae bacterium]
MMNNYNTFENNSVLSISDKAVQENYYESFVFMDESEYEFFEERAAIIEFESNMDRKTAERLAYDRIIRMRDIYARAS